MKLTTALNRVKQIESTPLELARGHLNPFKTFKFYCFQISKIKRRIQIKLLIGT